MPTALRVLILEDRPADAELMVDELTRAGFAPEWERVATQAAYGARLDSTLDLILADYSLPGFDALHALHLLHTRYLDIPFLVVTGSLEEAGVECMRQGAADYLLKDRLARLGPAVTRALETRRLREAARRAEAALRESEERYRLITEHVHDAIVLLALEGRVRYVNPAASVLTGYTVEELQNLSILQLVAPEGAPEVEARLAAARAGREVSPTIELQLIRKDQERLWIEASVRSVVRDGEAVGRLAVLRDISGRRTAEEALRHSEARFRSAFEEAAIGMALQDLGGRYFRVNAAFCQLLGYSEAELLTMSWRTLTHPADIEDDVERRLLSGEARAYQLERRYLHRDGPIVWAAVSASLLRDRESRPLYFIVQVQDITERKRGEDERVQLEAQLRQAQKMEAVGLLAGGIAHDFNNLLTIIMGRSELLRGRGGLDDRIRRELDLIQTAATRAAALTQQLLAFSRKQVLQLVVLDMNRVVAGVETMLRRLIGEPIDLVVDLGRALWTVKADAGQIEQVIMNLAVNARDAMPHGGRLSIATVNVELDDAFMRRHPGSHPGSHVVLSISDTGVGMDANTQRRLFEPFFTTKGPGKGTGLGLASVYGIVKQSDGWVGVESAPGQGAVFSIYLPRVEAAPEEVEPPRVSAAPSRGGETVLLVEDETEVRVLTREILEAYGYAVLEASRPSQALSLSRQHAGPIHLLVTDLVMPEMNGRELAERLVAERPDMKRLYVSGYTDDTIVHQGVLTPGSVLLQKPFTPDGLAGRVRAVLDALGTTAR